MNNDFYIFLDIDGVLNNYKYRSLNTNPNHDLDPSNVYALKELITKKHAKLIITSSRCSQEYTKELLDKELKEYNINVDLYLYKPSIDRTTLIKEYITEHKIINYLVFDDTEYNHREAFKDRFIKVDANKGLTI